MRNAVIVDASLLYALFDGSDAFHQDAVEYVSRQQRELLTTLAVITEVAYLLGESPARIDFLNWMLAGALTVVELTAEDFRNVIRVLQKYTDLPADFADATLVAVADRIEISEVATYDSDFHVYRYQRRRRFETPLLNA